MPCLRAPGQAPSLCVVEQTQVQTLGAGADLLPVQALTTPGANSDGATSMDQRAWHDTFSNHRESDGLTSLPSRDNSFYLQSNCFLSLSNERQISAPAGSPGAGLVEATDLQGGRPHAAPPMGTIKTGSHILSALGSRKPWGSPALQWMAASVHTLERFSISLQLCGL